ncbi:MAG: FlgD immunoglobulin-like domain containing protein [Candidatus Latescibacterota bacterium]
MDPTHLNVDLEHCYRSDLSPAPADGTITLTIELDFWDFGIPIDIGAIGIHVSQPGSAVEDGEDGEPLESPDVSITTSRPNPFGTTSSIIECSLQSAGECALTVHDVSGRSIRTLFQGALQASNHRFNWDSRDDNGRKVPAGIYYYRLHSDAQVSAREVMVIR